MDEIIAVGMGDYLQICLAPSLVRMQGQNLVNVVATVDVRERTETDPFLGVPHLRRREDQKLSDLLLNFRPNDPVVILGHANEVHTSDAEDLLKNGFRVMVEKPYAVDDYQFETIKQLVGDYPVIALLESFLASYSTPLLALDSLIKGNSFYFDGDLALQTPGGDPFTPDLTRRIEDIIGKPMSVTVDILEGDELYGTLDHRGPHLIDVSKGGGMIPDLAIHTIAPVMALEEYLGRVKVEEAVVRTARCDEYITMAKTKHDLPIELIGETCAEMDLETDAGVPVHLSMGKYIGKGNNRRMVVEGQLGTLYLNLTDCSLTLKLPNESPKPIIKLPSEYRYDAVIRAGLGLVSGDNSSVGLASGGNPFYLDPNQIALRAQRFVLDTVKGIDYGPKGMVTYKQGVSPGMVF